MSLLCCIDSNPVSEDRMKRKGYAAVTCSQECYSEFRRLKKRPTKGFRVSQEEYVIVMRYRRAKKKASSLAI